MKCFRLAGDVEMSAEKREGAKHVRMLWNDEGGYHAKKTSVWHLIGASLTVPVFGSKGENPET